MDFWKLIETFDAVNILVIASIFWYFTNGVRSEIKEEISAIRQENVTQANRSDRLYEMFVELLKK